MREPRYWPLYCEENVWHLCVDMGFDPAWAVFISNRTRTVALWSQRSAPAPELPVVWDYHVIMIASRDVGDHAVWDLDSRLALGVPLADYTHATFQLGITGPELAPTFRVVPAGDYRDHLASDRSHMRTASGEFSSPPPPWPALGTNGATNTLPRFIDMESEYLGEIHDLPGLESRFT